MSKILRLSMDIAKRRKFEIDMSKRSIKGEGDLEVTGISRSGRVRKKSSKLMDFESPDDIDTRFKKNTPAKPQPSPQLPQLQQLTQPPQLPQPPQPQQPQQPQQHQQVLYRHEGGQGDHEYENNDHQVKTDDVELDQGSESGSDYFDSTLENQDSMESDSDDDGLSDQEGSFNMSEVGQGNSAHPSHSLYMMEKSNKKKIIVKDGKVVGRAKAQRKDKGKTRVTAYMLWARNAREELLRKNPELDFSAISKRLGEMWANVNFQERYLWKRKAKRFALKKEQPIHKPQMVTNAPVQFSPRQQTPTNHNQPRNRSTLGGQSVRVQQVTNQNSVPQQQSVSPVSANSGVYKVSGCGPTEVAAHLKLLGESLAIIGERLKEHEGQIAVSGSVSVLLDTLLCSLAPLLCLTTCVPEIAPPTNLLQDTLDNIAYIMPGL